MKPHYDVTLHTYHHQYDVPSNNRGDSFKHLAALLPQHIRSQRIYHVDIRDREPDPIPATPGEPTLVERIHMSLCETLQQTYELRIAWEFTVTNGQLLDLTTPHHEDWHLLGRRRFRDLPLMLLDIEEALPDRNNRTLSRQPFHPYGPWILLPPTSAYDWTLTASRRLEHLAPKHTLLSTALAVADIISLHHHYWDYTELVLHYDANRTEP